MNSSVQRHFPSSKAILQASCFTVVHAHAEQQHQQPDQKQTASAARNIDPLAGWTFVHRNTHQEAAQPLHTLLLIVFVKECFFASKNGLGKCKQPEACSWQSRSKPSQENSELYSPIPGSLLLMFMFSHPVCTLAWQINKQRQQSRASKRKCTTQKSCS